MHIDYPPAHQGDTYDDYHGTRVPDPYRWLEDTTSDETITWGEAQSKLAFDYLAELPQRRQIHAGLKRLWNTQKYSAPQPKGERYFYFKNDGLQDQAVLYMQPTFEAEPQVVLDPNTFSEDGTVALGNLSISDDGTHIAYTLTSGGTDWQTGHILNVDTGETYPEMLEWVKFTQMAWTPDSSGFYYSRYPATDNTEDAASTLNNKLYFHQLGASQQDDTLIYERPDIPELAFSPSLYGEGRYLVLDIWHAAINRNRLYYRDLQSDDGFIRLFDEHDAEYEPIDVIDGVLYIQTDHDAPKSKIIAVDLTDAHTQRDIISQSEDTLLGATVVNHQLIVSTLHNAHTQINIYELDGTFAKILELPDLGTTAFIHGKADGDELFLQFQSYLYPPTVFRYDFKTGALTQVFDIDTSLDLDAYETRQVFYPSKDGTQVSMFITLRKDTPLNGESPTILYGYGGFSIALVPSYEPHILNWLDQGGIYAVANLRGGREYGEEWHQGGMLANKQNVFDDFISAGEWLIENGYTSSSKLAIMGRSNGGLLVAACMLQRPDLFGAVICNVPVTDMLRYHKFTAGRYWTAEYGNAEETPEHFEFMYKYSPVHNVQPGTEYPPTLILSADLDDRVVPMHAKKFAAALQAATALDAATESGAPILLRLDTRSGHGHGKPVSKWIEEWADIQAFLLNHLS